MLLNPAFSKVVNDQYLLKLLLGPSQTFWLHDASGSTYKKIRIINESGILKLNGNLVRIGFFFTEKSI